MVIAISPPSKSLAHAPSDHPPVQNGVTFREPGHCRVAPSADVFQGRKDSTGVHPLPLSFSVLISSLLPSVREYVVQNECLASVRSDKTPAADEPFSLEKTLHAALDKYAHFVFYNPSSSR